MTLAILLIGILNGTGDFFIKISSGKISPYLGSAILSATATIIPLTYLLLTKKPDHLLITKHGFLTSVIAGALIGTSATLLFLLFSQSSVNLSKAQPIVKTTVVITAITLGTLLLKEKLSPQHWLGVTLSITGIFILSK